MTEGNERNFYPLSDDVRSSGVIAMYSFSNSKESSINVRVIVSKDNKVVSSSKIPLKVRGWPLTLKNTDERYYFFEMTFYKFQEGIIPVYCEQCIKLFM